MCKNCKIRFKINKGIIDLLWKPSKAIKDEQKGWSTILKEKKEKNDQFLLSLPSPSLKETPHAEIWKDNAANFDMVMEKLNLKGSEKLLDIGAGRCWSSRLFAKKGLEVVALDALTEKYIGLESADIYIEQENLFFERIKADMNYLPVIDNYFDIVFSTASVHHSSDLTRLFKEVARVLKTGGRFILINEPVRGIFESGKLNNNEVKHGINEHNYRLIDYTRAAKNAGFIYNIFLPASIIKMLDTGEIKSNKRYKPLIGKVMAYLWKFKRFQNLFTKLNFFGQLLIGLGLVMIAKKK